MNDATPKITAADAVHILRLALVQAQCAIKGREHTGFITSALTATDGDFRRAERELHAAIMNLPVDVDCLEASGNSLAYKLGHQDARHAAAELASAPAAIQPAGDAPLCPHCGTHELDLARTCHNSSCSHYAVAETVHEGWRAAAPDSNGCTTNPLDDQKASDLAIKPDSARDAALEEAAQAFDGSSCYNISERQAVARILALKSRAAPESAEPISSLRDIVFDGPNDPHVPVLSAGDDAFDDLLGKYARAVVTGDIVACQRAADALRAAAAPAPRKLVWSDPMKPNTEVGYDHVTAETPFGPIRITWKSWKDDPSPTVDEHPVRGFFYAGNDVDDAKEKAEQAYFAGIDAGLPMRLPVGAPAPFETVSSVTMTKRPLTSEETATAEAIYMVRGQSYGEMGAGHDQPERAPTDDDIIKIASGVFGFKPHKQAPEDRAKWILFAERFVDAILAEPLPAEEAGVSVATIDVEDGVVVKSKFYTAELPNGRYELTPVDSPADIDLSGYEALEREHLGDADKQTGIYHPDNRSAAADAGGPSHNDALLPAVLGLDNAIHKVLIAGGDGGDELSDIGLRDTLKKAQQAAYRALISIGIEQLPGAVNPLRVFLPKGEVIAAAAPRPRPRVILLYPNSEAEAKMAAADAARLNAKIDADIRLVETLRDQKRDRRQANVPVAVERRSGVDRRLKADPSEDLPPHHPV